jgi:hypothetical protein
MSAESYLEEAMCKMVHHSTSAMDELVRSIVDTLSSSYVSGETVELEDSPGIEYKVVGRNDRGEYVVAEVDGEKESLQVEVDRLKRPPHSISNGLTSKEVSEWLTTSADVAYFADDDGRGCLWRVREPFRERFGLAAAIPEQFAGRVAFPGDTSCVEDSNECFLRLKELEFDGVSLSDSLFAPLLESEAATKERLANDPQLLSIFGSLRGVGLDGISAEEIIERMGESNPGKIANETESVLAACGKDPAFFKCSSTNEGAKFCLTASLARQVANKCCHIFQKCADDAYTVPDKKFFADRSTKPEDKIEPRQVECLRKLRDQHALSAFNDRQRQVKCSRCHRMVKSSTSDEEVQDCSTCVRAYHYNCIGEDHKARDSKVWSCPKCSESGYHALRKILELEAKLQTLMEKKRAASNKRQKVNKANQIARQSSKNYANRVDESFDTDMDALKLLKQQAKVESSEEKRRAAELVIEGPNKKYKMLFPTKASFEIFNCASSVVEFLSLYGDICELEEIPDTSTLLQSAKMPLASSEGLSVLYSQLLLCCLLEQLNRGGTLKSRARKWMRALTNTTWPEILRRYICQGAVVQQHQGGTQLRSAQEFLSRKPWWEMSPDLHLFLLHILCHDIAQGQALKTDMCGPAREYRTDCLGIDRYGRRYWWLRGSPSIITVEDHHGKNAGAISTTEEVDYLVKRLLPQGPGEGNLLAALQRLHPNLEKSFGTADASNSLIINEIKPQGTDPSNEERMIALRTEAIDEAKAKLENVIIEIANVNPQLERSVERFGDSFKPTTSIGLSDMCRTMLDLEAEMSVAGEGPPPHGSNKDVLAFLGEPHFRLSEPKLDSSCSKIELEESEALAFKSLRPFVVDPHEHEVPPVDVDDDFDCSDAEHAYLREKRMRKPARLWRSGRERAVWIKAVHSASNLGDAGVARAVFAAFILGDRILLLGERCRALEKELARQEEKEMIKIQMMEEEKTDMRARELPMIITTGRSKSNEGEVSVVLKRFGRDPLNLQIPSQEDVELLQWEYQCSICNLPGELLCCEHDSGCPVSCHIHCTGTGEPGATSGKWICLNHDDSKRRRAKRTNSSGSLMFTGDDDEETVTEEEDTISA